MACGDKAEAPTDIDRQCAWMRASQAGWGTLIYLALASSDHGNQRRDCGGQQDKPGGKPSDGAHGDRLGACERRCNEGDQDHDHSYHNQQGIMSQPRQGKAMRTNDQGNPWRNEVTFVQCNQETGARTGDDKGKRNQYPKGATSLWIEGRSCRPILPSQ